MTPHSRPPHHCFPRNRCAPRRPQHGGTLVGLIVGLIVGLTIAVVVALVITKGATPFTDKSGKLNKMGDPTPDQISDPNKPLYSSKDAARVANKELTEKAPAGAADPLAPIIAGIKAAEAPKPSAEPGKPAEAHAPAAPAAEAAPEDKFVYYLQAGAFRETADAENARAKLALLGFEAAVSDRSTDSGVLHRVRVGPFNQIESMNKARAKLLDGGIDVAIVRNQK